MRHPTSGPTLPRSRRGPVAPRWLGACLLALAAAPAWGAACAADLAGLRRLTGDAAFPVRWVETTMNDGRPLHLTLSERDGALHLSLDKSGQGLWAEGAVRICAAERSLQVRFGPGGLRTGPAAGWLLRSLIEGTPQLELWRPAAGELEVLASGWQGRFAATGGR